MSVQWTSTSSIHYWMTLIKMAMLMYLFCIYRPHLHCWVAMLGQGLSLLWAGTGWESCGAELVSATGAHLTELANSSAQEKQNNKRRTVKGGKTDLCLRVRAADLDVLLPLPPSKREIHFEPHHTFVYANGTAFLKAHNAQVKQQDNVIIDQ